MSQRSIDRKAYHEKPLVYACSGCSSAAQMANHLALLMDHEVEAEMSCIAGLGGDVKPLVKTAVDAAASGRPIIMIDGCGLKCGFHILARHGIEANLHWDLSRKDIKKEKHTNYDSIEAAQLALELREALQNLSHSFHANKSAT